MYIFNLHWDKVDNYRIDKYLMFLRHQLQEALLFVKKHEYKHVEWFNKLIGKLFVDENFASKGIPL